MLDLHPVDRRDCDCVPLPAYWITGLLALPGFEQGLPRERNHNQGGCVCHKTTTPLYRGEERPPEVTKEDELHQRRRTSRRQDGPKGMGGVFEVRREDPDSKKKRVRLTLHPDAPPLPASGWRARRLRLPALGEHDLLREIIWCIMDTCVLCFGLLLGVVSDLKWNIGRVCGGFAPCCHNRTLWA